jgi:uncharacterized protein
MQERTETGMKIAVAGGTGFIGSALVRHLSGRGDQVLILTRKEGTRPDPTGITRHRWDARTPDSLGRCLEGFDAIVNLTGESLAARRWSPAQKARIVDSRVESTRAIVSNIKNLDAKPRILVNASAVGYYGSVPEGEVTETHRKGKGFLVAVTERWEDEAKQAEKSGVRVVLPRIGLVLGAGGALPRMVLPYRFWFGGAIGSGLQWMPWIHIDDLVSAFRFVISEAAMAGPVNFVAPSPVTMGDFSSAIAKTLHRPNFFKVPEIVLRAVLGEMADMLLTGQRAVPEKLMKNGFTFRYNGIESALKEILA